MLYSSTLTGGKRGVLTGGKLDWNHTWPNGTFAGGRTHIAPLLCDRLYLHNAANGNGAVFSLPPTGTPTTDGAANVNPGQTAIVTWANGYLMFYKASSGEAWLDTIGTSSPFISSLGAVTGLATGWDFLVPVE